MTVALSKSHIKRRVDDYLWYNNAMPVQRLRELLLKEFLPHGEVAIIGGLLRDLTRKGPSGYKSDIDLVFDLPPSRVAEIATGLGAKKNRFGGFGLRTPLWKVDFWALRNTWAHVAGYASVRKLADLTEVTFFNVDAIIYVIGTRSILAQENYINSIFSRYLEINLLPNPSIDGNMVRAVRRLLGWNMKPGPRLSTFLEGCLDQKMFEHIKKTELGLYPNSFAERYDSANRLLDALLEGTARRPVHAQVASQYHLPF